MKTLRAIDFYAGPGGAGSDDPTPWVRSATHYSPFPLRQNPGFSARLLLSTPFLVQAWLDKMGQKDVVSESAPADPRGRQSLWSLPSL